MKKFTRRFLSLALALCLVMAMAGSVFAASFSNSSSFAGYGYTAYATCDDDSYYCTLGSASDYYIRIKARCYETKNSGESKNTAWKSSDNYVLDYATLYGGPESGYTIVHVNAQYYINGSLVCTGTATP